MSPVIDDARTPVGTSRKADVSGKIAETRSFLGKVWTLAKPYWNSEEKWFARGMLAVVIGLGLFLVYLNKQFNDWNRNFYDAIQNKDEAAFYRYMFSLDSFGDFMSSFTGLAFVYIVVAVYRLWLRQFLQIRWRRWLTEVYYADWLNNRTYYRMELANHGADNPEQRIEYDINQFTSQTLTISLGLINEIVTLVTFTAVLWNLSGSLTVAWLGGLEIPAYMMWAAALYAVVGSIATFYVGRPLVRTNFELERANADFRYRMTRIRDNQESIALYGGETDEKRRLDGSFGRVYGTFWDFMRYNKRLTWLQSFYGQAAVVFPFIVQAPRYFSGEITFGQLTQTAGAFGQVQSSLSWFVDTYDTLAVWKATTDRLTGFSETMIATKRDAARPEITVDPHDGTALEIEHVDVRLPNGDVLLQDVDLAIDAGQRIIVQGPSGSGKTTFFRALAGLWPYGHGVIRVPRAAEVLFLPQKPYMPLGTLREALTYPRKPDGIADARIQEALEACRLPNLVDRLDEVENWAMALSPGEQQRLAFARILLLKPDWLFLDEATSALDEATETHVYELIRERLPNATLISIAHKPSVIRYHEMRLRIDPTARRVLLEPLGEADKQGG